MNRTIIGAKSRWDAWLGSPPGGYALEWERAQFDAGVADVFGYFALQCGMPQVDCLRESRIQTRIAALGPDDRRERACAEPCSEVHVAHYEELPFGSQSLDLVVMPHTLESSQDPHQVLREVERVLRPEGRLLVTGFNPISLWGLRQAVPGRFAQPFLPPDLRPVSAPRLSDWLRLLGFGIDRVRYGCYRPPSRGRGWLERTAFMERAGDRWWPVCGAVWCVSAVKRVRGMRLLGPAWKVPSAAGAPARVASPPASVQAPTADARVSDTCSRGSTAAD